MDARLLRRRVVVAGLGLLLAMALLEGGLYATRLVMDLFQEHRTQDSLGGPGEERILCLGDSTTELGGDGAWPHQLELVLREIDPGSRYRVINGGRTCTDTGDVAADLQRNLDRYRPRLVVVMVGINEHGVRMYRQVPTSGTLLFKHSRAYRLLVLVTWKMLGGEERGGPEPGMYREPTTRRNLEAVARTLRRRGIPMVAMQYPRRPAAPLRELLRGLHVVVVDNRSIFEEALKRGRYEDYFIDRFAGDFGHCTSRGSRLLAENLARTMRSNGLLSVSGAGKRVAGP